MSLFGKPTTPFGGNSLFGNTTNNQQQQQQSQPSSSLFGNTTAAQPQQQSSLFGNTNANQPQQQQQSSLFGNSNVGQPQQQQQQQSGLFGQSAQQQQPPMNQSRSSTMWEPESVTPTNQKPIAEQILTLYNQWRPDAPTCGFKTYLYNTVAPSTAIYHRPDGNDDEQKWEEALSKRPDDGSIPVRVQGFYELGRRLETQVHAVQQLQQRIHEVHRSCVDMTTKYHVEISVRAADAKRKHIALSQRCLRLATKVQILRNAGYTLDSAEEELKKKLTDLEKKTFDPSLLGRQEEIWARLVNVRERARFLQDELDKKGGNAAQAGESISDDAIKRAKEILTNYDSQLSHLTKEISDIGKEFSDWMDSDERSRR